MGHSKSWFDRGGMGLLIYAVTADEFVVEVSSNVETRFQGR